MVVYTPGVSPAGHMGARGYDDIAAVGSDIEARPEPSGAVAQPRHMPEQDMLPAGPGDLPHCGRQRAVLVLQLPQRVVTAVVGVEVQGEEPRRLAGRDADVHIRPPAPPAADLL